MSDATAPPAQARVRRHGWFSWIWLIPIGAIGLVLYLAISTYSKRGPLVTLTLATAEGVQVNQTQVKHKAVPLGTVEDVRLSDDMTHVTAHLRMNQEAEPILTDHARFWVVRPRLTAGSLTGLETIVSGAYIEVDPGPPGGKSQRQFEALADPPGRRSDEPGHVYALRAGRLGSLSVGARLYNRDVEVGEVLSYELRSDPDHVALRVFVRDPFDRLVHEHTRFWNVSGVAIAMSPTGLHVELESLQSVFSGGIAFETAGPSAGEPPAPEDAQFVLYPDKDRADDDAFAESLPYVTYLDTSIQGLNPGSPVQLYGVQVGSVTDVRLAYDEGKRRPLARVAFKLQPDRIGGDPGAESLRRALADMPLRAQLESSSFITGTKDIALYPVPGARPANVPHEGDAVVVPGEGGGVEALTASLSDVANRLDRVPFEQIGQNMNGALASLQHLATQIDTQATPALQQLPAIFDGVSKAVQNANGALSAGGYGQNSEFEHGMKRVMNQVSEAARSFRALADYLDRHPEALIRGRSGAAEAQ